MKLLSTLTLALVAGFAIEARAEDNIALGKSVTLYGTFGTDPGPWTSESPVPAASLTDGVFLNETHQWDLDSVWWNGSAHPEDYAQIDLGGAYTISGFTVQADDNDTYRIQYRVGDGDWQTAWEVPAIASWGLVTRTTTLSEPIVADALRFTATSGDSYYSVSEIQAIGVAVPEPGMSGLLAAALGVLGFAVRRK